jgi:hypothetical protein
MEKPNTSTCVRPSALMNAARGAGDAGVVEQDDLAALCNTVGDSRIPMIHRAGEVNVEHKRHAPCLAEAPVCKANAVGFHILGRSGLMAMAGHGCFSGVG